MTKEELQKLEKLSRKWTKMKTTNKEIRQMINLERKRNLWLKATRGGETMTKEEFCSIPLAEFAKKLDHLDRMALAKEENPEEYKKQILSKVYDLIVKYQEKEAEDGG